MDQPPLETIKGSQVLVTGATGFTGSWLTRKLAEGGVQVRAIARQSSDISALQPLPIEWFRGDVYDPAILQAAADGVQYIFHVAAAFRQAGIDDDEYRRVHIESTKLLAALAAGRSGFKRFIHVSTMGVHGHIENPPGNENSPYGPGDIYQVTKLEAELWLHDYARSTGLPYTVIRPTAIYGPGDRRLLKVFKMAAMPVFPILGHGKCLYHLIHVDDLTDAMITAAVRPAALSEPFIIGSDEAIRLEDMAAIIARTYSRKPRILRIPAGPVFAAADVCEAICRPLGIEPPLYRRRVAFYTKDRSFDVSKMKNVLGFQPRYGNEEGIVQTARWYLEQGWVKL